MSSKALKVDLKIVNHVTADISFVSQPGRVSVAGLNGM